MTPFRVVGATTRWQSDFVEVDELDVEGPENRHFTRVVVRHPGAVAVVPVDGDRQHVFLVRQFRSAVGRELLEIPAGKRDVDGEPPEETARRELEEEVGQRARRLVHVGAFYNSPGFCDEHTHVYCAFDLEPAPATWAATDEEAEMTIERIALVDVDALIADSTIVDAKTIIGLHLAQRHLDARGPATP